MVEDEKTASYEGLFFRILIVMIRQAQIATFLIALSCSLSISWGSNVWAEDRLISKRVWESVPPADAWIPATLTAGPVVESHYGNCTRTAMDTTLLTDQTTDQTFSANRSATPSASQIGGAGTGKTGTGLDALPSFRGIKGIKNLPGGVGTLLMANPHVGATWYPEQNTDQAGTSLSMQRTYFQGAVPVYQSGADTYVLTAHVDETSIQTNAILPTTMQAMPNQLFNIAFGMNYFHQFEGGNVGGIVFDVGSASDRPFQSGREILASGTGFLLMPQDEKSSWFVGVNASTNSQVLYGVPIPGGGYFYHPSEDFQAILGFPFSVVSWKVARDWQLQYVWAFLTTMHARTVYQPTPDWQFYAGFDWTNENWRLAERVNEKDHFFYYEKKLATGLLWWFSYCLLSLKKIGFRFPHLGQRVQQIKHKGVL